VAVIATAARGAAAAGLGAPTTILERGKAGAWANKYKNKDKDVWTYVQLQLQQQALERYKNNNNNNSNYKTARTKNNFPQLRR